MTQPLEILRAYASGAADVDAVMRVLASHDGWLAPAVLFGEDNPEFDRILMLSDEIELPANQLLLFSDDDQAHRFAARFPTLGILAADLSAERAFSLLDDRYESLVINPGSPESDRWYAGRDAFELVRVWIEAMVIEKALARFPDGAEELTARLAVFAGVTIPIMSGRPVGLPDVGDFKSTAIVCTSPDSGKAFAAKLAPSLREGLQWGTGSGRDICQALIDEGFEAIAFNPAGPGPNPVISIELARAVLR